MHCKYGTAINFFTNKVGYGRKENKQDTLVHVMFICKTRKYLHY